jgi:ABC-2 type transport system ATP-binding protein
MNKNTNESRHSEKHASAPLLSLRSVEKTFRNDVFKPPVQSLKGIDLDFPEGVCTGLVGHNGAGKTTTIRMILGLLKPDRGSILFKGQPIARDRRATIGYMAESARFPGGLTANEILKTQLAIHGVPKSQRPSALVSSKLESVGLANHANRRIRDFSKGMMQRLAWAHATIHSPNLLILDEPFTGLDPLGRITMKNWILAEKKRGVSILLCTHELPQIMSLCDHIHILRQGKLVYSSLDNHVPGGSLDQTLPRYFVDLSGTTMDALDQLRAKRNLPKWQAANQEGFLVRLGFRDYPSAASWLEPAMTSGYVIVKFGDDNSATEEQLLVHFKEEFSL